EREHDPAARRLVLHVVKPAAQRRAARARDPIDGLVRPAALFDLARPRQTARGQPRQGLVDLALGRRPDVGDVARREPRETVARSFAEGHEAKDGALGGGAEVQTDWQVGSPITFKGEWNGKSYEDTGESLAFEPERTFA